MPLPHFHQVRCQPVQYPLRQHRDPIALPFPPPHPDFPPGQVHILDPQGEALEQPQAAAVQQLPHQRMAAVKLRKHPGDLIPGQYRRDPGRRPPPRDPAFQLQRLLQHLAIEELQRRQRLHLRRRRNPLPLSQVVQERHDLTLPHLGGMAQVMKSHISNHPPAVSLLRSQAIVAQPELCPQQRQQGRLRLRVGRWLACACYRSHPTRYHTTPNTLLPE